MTLSLKRLLLVYPEPHFCSGGGIATYLRFAIQAHLDAGRDVHLLTWATGTDTWFHQEVTDSDLLPLSRDQVTIVKLSEDEIHACNRTGIRSKNISDLLCPYIKKLEADFHPDLIESTDFAAPLHTYLEEKRCALHSSNVRVAIFNHGLLTDIWPAAALIPSETVCRELVLEQQVVQWADFILAPSAKAAARLGKLRQKTDGVILMREPFYAKEWRQQDCFAEDRFVYFGRVSFAKGVDIFAGMLTATAGRWPVSQITFLGRKAPLPFRQSEISKYVLARLHKSLVPKARFRDSVSHHEVAGVISKAGFFGNFSRSESFSYTTLEALQNGVVPLVMRDSAMAEFLPPEMRSEGTFSDIPHRTDIVTRVLTYWRDDYRDRIAAAQAYAAKLTDPTEFAARYNSLQLEPSIGNKQRGVAQYSGSDVTILMATHNDANLALNAVASIKQQTVGPKEIIVLDDGSTDPEQIARLDAMAEQNDVRLIRVNNMGLVAGRNYLVENAQTSLVIFLDADDLLEPTYIQTTLAALNTQPDQLSAVLTRRKNFGLNTDESAGFLLGTPLHWVCNDFRMTALIKTEVLKTLPFEPEIRNGEADDWWWWLRFTIHGHKAVFVPRALFLYSTTPGSMSLPWSEGQAALTIELLKKAASEAQQCGFDLTEPMQMTLLTAYRSRRDLDAKHQQSATLPAEAGVIPMAQRNALAYAALTKRLHRILGAKVASAVIDRAEKTVYSQPIIRRGARIVLRSVSALQRSR